MGKTGVGIGENGKKCGTLPKERPGSSLAAAAVIVVVAAAVPAPASAAVAEQQDQDDDPPPVVVQAAAQTVIVATHRNTSEAGFFLSFTAHSMLFCVGIFVRKPR